MKSDICITVNLARQLLKDKDMEPKHCDDYIDAEGTPPCLSTFLLWARGPAHGMTEPSDKWPQLYATWEGRRVRVVMASRFGNVGIAYDLSREYGYDTRVWIEELSDFWETP